MRLGDADATYGPVVVAVAVFDFFFFFSRSVFRLPSSAGTNRRGGEKKERATEPRLPIPDRPSMLI